MLLCNCATRQRFGFFLAALQFAVLRFTLCGIYFKYNICESELINAAYKSFLQISQQTVVLRDSKTKKQQRKTNLPSGRSLSPHLLRSVSTCRARSVELTAEGSAPRCRFTFGSIKEHKSGLTAGPNGLLLLLISALAAPTSVGVGL